MTATASRERATQVLVGATAPLGASVTPDGVNFSVFSKHATGIDLLLFDHVDAAKPTRVIDVSSVANRTYHYWHVFVPGLKAGQIYGFRAQVHSTRRRATGSTPARSSWIRTGVVLSCRTATTVPRRTTRAITL